MIFRIDPGFRTAASASRFREAEWEAPIRWIPLGAAEKANRRPVRFSIRKDAADGGAAAQGYRIPWLWRVNLRNDLVSGRPERRPPLSWAHTLEAGA